MFGLWLNTEIGELSPLLCFFRGAIWQMKNPIEISQLEKGDKELVCR